MKLDFEGQEKRALYSITRFGHRGLTVASAHDLASYEVLVNSASPGFVRTELTIRCSPNRTGFFDSVMALREINVLAARSVSGPTCTSVISENGACSEARW